ncbi:threonine/serine exporter family protein [Arthrobacter pigmenti]
MAENSSGKNATDSTSAGKPRPDPSTLHPGPAEDSGQQSVVSADGSGLHPDQEQQPPALSENRPSPARLAGQGRPSPSKLAGGAGSPSKQSVRGRPSARLARSVRSADVDARRAMRRLVQGEVPKQPRSLIENLAGGPYSQARTRTVSDADSREIVDLALRVAEGMSRFGGGALEAESSIVAIAAAYGLRDIEVDITNQSVKVNYPDTTGEPVSMMRVVRSWSQNYGGLARIHQLVREISGSDISRNAASQKLQTIMTSPKPFPKWVVIGSSAIAGAALTGVTGGGFFSCLVAFFNTLMAQFLARQLSKWRVPEFFTMAACAMVITLTAIAIYSTGLPVVTGFIVAGGIILLLPTGRVISATQDAINGFPVTAAGRFSSAFLVLSGLVSGIALAVVTGALLGIGRIDVTEEAVAVPPVLLGALLVVATSALAVAEQTRPEYVLPTALVGLVGLLVMNGYLALGAGSVLGPAVGATVVGIGSRLVARRYHVPQLVIAVPGVTFLLPGLMLFRSLYGMTVESIDSVEGFVGLFNALTVTLSIAGGVVLGDNLARPFTGAGWPEAKRNRRR